MELSESATLTETAVEGGLVILKRAVEIYLPIAYPSGEIPLAVSKRLVWDRERSFEELLAAPPFERANRPRPGVDPIYALRLGNAVYPHMKLQVQSWENREGVLLSVNTHDQALMIESLGPEAVRAGYVRSENHRIKLEIEKAWEADGLPVFLGYLKDYLAAGNA